jgi:hypothetical protein
MRLKTRRSPGLEARATSTTPIAANEFIKYRRQDGCAAPTAEDRREAEVLAGAEKLGYRLATRCTRCQKWVVSHENVAAHIGPVCRAKVGRDG